MKEDELIDALSRQTVCKINYIDGENS